tara:strand:+ start:69 stop:377 length:309 start_codon:yes stop_codon:yes gene_type:complete
MRDPVRLSEAISEFIAKRGIAARRSTDQLAEVWQTVSGERIAANTRYLHLRDQVIHIGVFNSALLTELVSFQSKSLLEKLNAECPDLEIIRIRFQLKSQTSA